MRRLPQKTPCAMSCFKTFAVRRTAPYRSVVAGTQDDCLAIHVTSLAPDASSTGCRMRFASSTDNLATVRSDIREDTSRPITSISVAKGFSFVMVRQRSMRSFDGSHATWHG